MGTVHYGAGHSMPPDPDGVPFVRATDVFRGRIVTEGIQRVRPVKGSRLRHLKPGDIIVVRSGAYAGDSATIPEDLNGALLGYDMRIRIDKAVPRFIAWTLLADYVLQGQLHAGRGRAAQPHVNSEELSACEILVPTIRQQSRIADFLDRETAHIDRLIETKERLIALLEEKRSALITQAVTKGLDPDVPMKDSGVEWIGEIPEHWEAVQIRRVARVESGHTPTRGVPDFWEDGSIPWVSLADTGRLRRLDTVSEAEHSITWAGIANSSARLLPKGSVMFARDASVGLAAVAGTELTAGAAPPTSDGPEPYVVSTLRNRQPVSALLSGDRKLVDSGPSRLRRKISRTSSRIVSAGAIQRATLY